MTEDALGVVFARSMSQRASERATDSLKDKQCSICSEIKPFVSFRRHSNQCNRCRTVRNGVWRNSNLEKVRVYSKRWRIKQDQGALHRKWRYGMKGDEYARLLATQNGLCAACGKSETRKGPTGLLKPLSVDHCHKQAK